MLTIIIPKKTLFIESTSEFIDIKEDTSITMEHSLISISKWESKWKKPFLSTKLNNEEMLDYIRCMTITKGISDEVYLGLTEDNIIKIRDYINDPMTATKISSKGRSREIITSELIYYWMTACNIPVDFEKWHINRLLTLIQVCSEKNAPKKNMSKKSIMSQNASLNAARRAKLHSKG